MWTPTARARPGPAPLRRGALALVLLLALAPCVGSSRASAQEPDRAEAVLESAARRYSALYGFCADFRQEVRVPVLDQTTRSAGRLCQRKPNLFSMRFTDPDGDRIVGDGEWLWVYYPSMDARQVMKFRLGSGDRSFDFQREFLDDPASKYEARFDGSESLDGNAVDRVELTPRAAAAYQGATLWIDTRTHLIRKAEIRQENGSVRLVTLSGIEVDLPVPEGTFRFVPPPNARIIEQ